MDFYSGLRGESLGVKATFQNGKILAETLSNNFFAIGDYVFINYGDLSNPSYSVNLKADQQFFGIDRISPLQGFHNSLWQKTLKIRDEVSTSIFLSDLLIIPPTQNFQVDYKWICSFPSAYPRIEVQNQSIPPGANPEVSLSQDNINSSNPLGSVKMLFKLPRGTQFFEIGDRYNFKEYDPAKNSTKIVKGDLRTSLPIEGAYYEGDYFISLRSGALYKIVTKLSPLVDQEEYEFLIFMRSDPIPTKIVGYLSTTVIGVTNIEKRQDLFNEFNGARDGELVGVVDGNSDSYWFFRDKKRNNMWVGMKVTEKINYYFLNEYSPNEKNRGYSSDYTNKNFLKELVFSLDIPNSELQLKETFKVDINDVEVENFLSRSMNFNNLNFEIVLIPPDEQKVGSAIQKEIIEQYKYLTKIYIAPNSYGGYSLRGINLRPHPPINDDLNFHLQLKIKISGK